MTDHRYTNTTAPTPGAMRDKDYSSRNIRMAAFDALPQVIRDALNECARTFSVYKCHQALIEGVPAAQVAAAIRRSSDKYILRQVEETKT